MPSATTAAATRGREPPLPATTILPGVVLVKLGWRREGLRDGREVEAWVGRVRSGEVAEVDEAAAQLRSVGGDGASMAARRVVGTAVLRLAEADVRRAWAVSCSKESDKSLRALLDVWPATDRAVQAVRVADGALQLDGLLLRELNVSIQLLMLTDAVKDALREYFVSDLARRVKREGENDDEMDATTDDDHEARIPRDKVDAVLSALGLRSALDAMFAEAAYSAVTRHVAELVAESGLETPDGKLDGLLEWTRTHPVAWLATFATDDQRWRLEFFAHQALGRVLQRELFSLVMSFPDTEAALVDLRRCLGRTKGHADVASSLRESLERRLLHSGVATNSILVYYVRMIRALRVLDPTGEVLETVAKPVKAYLRTRPETVRCVVTALTNDGANEELHAELGLEQSRVFAPIDLDADTSGVLDLKGSGGGGGSHDDGPSPAQQDALATLVRIFGTKEVFAEEYKTLLADRLLKSGFDVDMELRSLELLKLRFGEATMRTCSIMLGDVEESRRVNQLVRREPDAEANKVEAVVVSRHFWPRFAADRSKLHSDLRRPLQHYASLFARLKKPKRLVWHPSASSVDLNVRVGGVVREFRGVPLPTANVLAVVVKPPAELSGSGGAVKAEDVARVVGSSVEAARRRLGFWVHEGVLQIVGGFSFAPVETFAVGGGLSEPASASAPAAQGGGSVGMESVQRDDEGEAEGDEEDQEDQDDDEDDDDEDIGPSTLHDVSGMIHEMDVEDDNAEGGGGDGGGGGAEEDDAMLSQFISNMLSAQGELPTDAIHRNLQMFGAMLAGGYSRTERELEVFLEALVSRGELVARGDAYAAVDS